MSFSGPQFLGLYAAVAILANWWLRRHYRRREAGTSFSSLDFSGDPYQIAFLRAGDAAAVDVVVFALLDRGLLEENDGLVRTARPDARELARRPLEQAVLGRFKDWGRPEEARRDADVRHACETYRESLVGHRLLAGPVTYAQRWAGFLAALGLTVGIAGARLVNAVLQGRPNVGFLVLLTLACAAFLIAAYRRRLTGLGEETVERLRRLFAGLKRRADRIQPGGATHDAVIVAALFGFAVLPTAGFPFVPRLFGKRGDSGDAGSSGDGGGSCDGGGCGGGGCGGGCGG